MTDTKKNICVYYQAIIKREECWLLTATLRSFEHLCFDRTLNKEKSMFEFFVPENMEPFFLRIMEYYKTIGLVIEMEKLPNRMAGPGSKL